MSHKSTNLSPVSGNVNKADGTNLNIADILDAIYSTEENSIMYLSHVSSRVRRGQSYRFFYDTEITNGGTYNLQFKTGAKKAYVTGVVVVPEAELFTENFIEDPTITDGDSEIPIHNANRNSENTSAVTIYDNPTSVSGGTTFESIYMPGETGVGQQRKGERYAGTLEWILLPSTDYVLQIVNNGGGASDVHLEMHWYEL